MVIKMNDKAPIEKIEEISKIVSLMDKRHDLEKRLNDNHINQLEQIVLQTAKLLLSTISRIEAIEKQLLKEDENDDKV